MANRADGADRPDARGPGPATKDCPGSCSALSTEIYFNIHTRRSVCARRSRPEGSAGFFGQPALEPSPPRRSFAARRSSEALPIHLPRSAMRLGTQTATGSFAMTSSTRLRANASGPRRWVTLRRPTGEVGHPRQARETRQSSVSERRRCPPIGAKVRNAPTFYGRTDKAPGYHSPIGG